MAMAEVDFARLLPVPSSFLCPITQELMTDPVAAADGSVYERAAITEWLRNPRGGQRSPLTNLPLPTTSLSPVLPLRKAIEEYLLYRPQLIRRELDRRSLEEVVQVLLEEAALKTSRLAAVKAGREDQLLEIKDRLARLQDEVAELHALAGSFDDLLDFDSSHVPGGHQGEFLHYHCDKASAEPTALLAAIESCDEAVALCLLRRPEPPFGLNAVDEDGWSPLHWAVSLNLTETALALLARKDFSQVNAKTSVGTTALHLAAWEGDAAVCRGILRRPDFRKLLAVDDAEGMSALQRALWQGHKEAAEVLEKAETELHVERSVALAGVLFRVQHPLR